MLGKIFNRNKKSELKMSNNKFSSFTKGVLKLIGERYPYLESKDMVLVSLFIFEVEKVKQKISEKFTQALIYHLEQEGVPFSYKFKRIESGLYSEELKADLKKLYEEGDIIYNDEIKLTTKGKNKAENLLKAIIDISEEEEIRNSLLPIKQLLSD